MDKSTILVIDDDPKLRSLIGKILVQEGFHVVGVGSGQEARAFLQTDTVDVILLDVMMPKEDGYAVADRFKLQGTTAPIIFLTALNDPSDRVRGLELGAQDYLAKPFEPRELILRIRNCLHRGGGAKAGDGSGVVSFGLYTFDTMKKALYKDGQLIVLTDLERQLLQALALKADVPLSREKLAQTNMGTISDRTVDVQIARLRRKIEEDPRLPRYIQTVRHKGYILVTEGPASPTDLHGGDDD